MVNHAHQELFGGMITLWQTQRLRRHLGYALMTVKQLNQSLRELLDFVPIASSLDSAKDAIRIAGRFMSKLYQLENREIASSADLFESFMANEVFKETRQKLRRQLCANKTVDPDVVARLGSPDYLCWDYKKAIEDADHLLSLKLGKTTEVVKKWRGLLFDLRGDDEDYHIVGCYLLRRCGIEGRDDRTVLAKRMRQALPRLMEVIRAAAKFLTETDEKTGNTTSSSVPQRRLSKTDLRILEACREESYKGETLANKVGLSFDYARRLFARLVKDGFLTNDEDGYRTVSSGL